MTIAVTIAVRAVALALAVAVIPAATVRGQDTVAPRRLAISDSALEVRTSAVAATLRCPVCQGESIQDSPASLAREMRAVVKERLRAGETPDQVKAYFVGRYGEWILLEPTTTGLNLALYILPVALVVGGLALVVILVRRWTAAPSVTEP